MGVPTLIDGISLLGKNDHVIGERKSNKVTALATTSGNMGRDINVTRYEPRELGSLS